MANYQKLFPSKYVKAADLDGQDKRVTIDRLDVEWIGSGNDAEEKPVLYFADHDQGLVLNKTNATTIAEMYGEETDRWAGKPITLYPDRVQFGSKMVDCVRVRLQQQKLQPGEATEAVAVGAEDGSGDVPF